MSSTAIYSELATIKGRVSRLEQIIQVLNPKDVNITSSINDEDILKIKKEFAMIKVLSKNAIDLVTNLQKDVNILKQSAGVSTNHNNVAQQIIDGLAPVLAKSNSDLKDTISNIKVAPSKYSQIPGVKKLGGKFIPSINSTAKTNITIKQNDKDNLDETAKLLKQMQGIK